LKAGLAVSRLARKRHVESSKEELMRTMIAGGLALGLLLAGARNAMAQLDVGDSGLNACSQIDSLSKAGNYSAAHEKAQACLTALDQKLQGEVGKQFPQTVAGWTRGNLQQNTVAGFNNVSATYKKQTYSADVSLTAGSGGSGSLGGLIGGIARMGMQAGQQVKVAGLPASVQTDGTIAVTLDSGAFLTFKSAAFSDQKSALAGLGDLVNAFPVAQINKTLK
jgi:hypothetical protein